MLYVITSAGYSIYLIYKVAPHKGRKNILIYLAICSLVGSISVMAVKGFGIALKLTFSGHNQLLKPSTYVFGATVVVCALTQINYFNKALDAFHTNRVTPGKLGYIPLIINVSVYYVMFTTATILASVLLFEGFNDSSAVSSF